MLHEMHRQVQRRLHDEAGIHATDAEVGEWDVPQLQATTRWMDALLRRKESTPFAGDTYAFPPHVKAVVAREASV